MYYTMPGDRLYSSKHESFTQLNGIFLPKPLKLRPEGKDYRALHIEFTFLFGYAHTSVRLQDDTPPSHVLVIYTSMVNKFLSDNKCTGWITKDVHDMNLEV